jgi:hypothetical protein
MRRASRSGSSPPRARVTLLLVAATLALYGCGGSSSSGPATTVVGGAPLHLPDDAAIQQGFGPDAKLTRSKPLRGGAIDRACGLGNLPLRTRHALGVEGRAPGNVAVRVGVVLFEFASPGVASSFFTALIRGKPGCEWTDVNKQKRRLAQAVPLDDVGGARVIGVTIIHDTATGESSTSTVVLRNATVANLVATPATVAAGALNKMAALLTN